MRKIAGLKSQRGSSSSRTCYAGRRGRRTARQAKIANEFAEFYGKSHRDLQHCSGSNQQADAHMTRAPFLSTEELRTALQPLKAEIHRGSHRKCSNVAARHYARFGQCRTTASSGQAPIPTALKKAAVKALHRSWYDIAAKLQTLINPLPCNLPSRLLCNRLPPILDRDQCPWT